MQYIYYIRSYQKFPSVIPVLRVSPLRVTHPSAMVPNIASYIFPINLHVLSILSAFILSQDQTLHSIYFSHIFSFHLFFVLWQRFLFITQNLFASLLLLIILFPIVLAYLCGWQKLYYQIYYLLSIPFFYLFSFFLSPPLLLYPFINPYMHYISSPLLFPNTICCILSLLFIFCFFLL